MKRYIITTEQENALYAGPKARRDAEAIALRAGYQGIEFEGPLTAQGSISGGISLLIRSLRNWRKLERSANADSVVLIQFPLYPIKTAYVIHRRMQRIKRKRGIRFIALIHDLDSVRGLFGKAGVYNDTRVLPLFDVVICHNTAMKGYLVNRGLPERKIVTLGIFDYLTEAKCNPHHSDDGLAFAGNLNPEKSRFLEKMNSGQNSVLHLYGNGASHFPERAVYHGAFSPDELPGKLEGAFGLVWDGESTDGCSGLSGEYMRYNNPHKLSLYLASGMPVIIWNRAALAEFVKRKGIGLTVGNLKEIRLADVKDYDEMLENAAKLGRDIRAGKHLQAALSRAEDILAEQ